MGNRIFIDVRDVWTPAELSTEAWYDANDTSTITFGAGSNVSQWDDKSSNGRHLSQGTGGNQPFYNAIDSNLNDMPSMTVNGSKRYWDTILQFQIKRVYAVTYVTSAWTTFRVLFDDGGGNNEKVQGKLPGNVWEGKGSWGDENYFLNASDTSQATTPMPMLPSLWRFEGQYLTTSRTWRVLGGKQSYHFWDNGGLGEFITTDGTESTDDRQKIEGYLAWKWGTQDSLPSDHPYKENRPLV